MRRRWELLKLRSIEERPRTSLEMQPQKRWVLGAGAGVSELGERPELITPDMWGRE